MDSMDCPHCGYPLSFIGNDQFECDYCGEEYSRWQLIDEESFQDEETRRARCPNGCGVVRFKRQHQMWACTECGMPYYEGELEEENTVPEEAHFGLCKHCGEWTLIESDGLEFYCTHCATTDELSAVMYTELEKAHRWAGELTGCYACGEEAPQGAKVGEPTICGNCSCTFTPTEKMKRSCPHCLEEGPVGHRIGTKHPDTVHVRALPQKRQDLFFCLTCKKSFVVNWVKCGCGCDEARISSASTYGWLFKCPRCGKEFMEGENKVAGGRSRIYAGWDDDDWGWIYNREVDIEDCLKRKYLVESEI